MDYEVTEACQAEYELFVKDSSVLFFDGMYTAEELPNFRGFGHSCWEQGIQIMESCNIGQLCITHHDWARNDSELAILEQKAKEMNSRCIFSREGMKIHFDIDK